MVTKKKGMFMTISILMLGVIILSLVIFLSEQITESKISAAGFSEIDKTAGKYANIEDEISKIISFYINISTNNNTVTIEEPLPFPSKMTNALEAFSQFENNYAEQNVSINLTNAKIGNFIIMPNLVNIISYPGNFTILPENSTGAGGIKSYFVELTFNAGDIKSITWNNISNSSGNLVPIHVKAHDPNYATTIDLYANIDRNSKSELSLNSGLNNLTQVGIIKFSSPTKIEINGGKAIALKTIVEFYNLVTVETNDTIIITSTVNKTGKVKIT